MLDILSFSCVGLSIMAIAILLRIRIFRNWNRLPLPPGPKPLPLIGNVLDMPKYHEWYTYQDWNKKYGLLN